MAKIATFLHIMEGKRGVTVISLLFTLVFFLLLAVICIRVRVGSRFHRGLTRSLRALWTLIACALIPGLGIGVNAVNVACVSLLGLPGLGLLAVLARLP